jgi:hypothetical protein
MTGIETDSAWTLPQEQSLPSPFNRTGSRVAGATSRRERAWRPTASNLQAEFHAICSNGGRAFELRPRLVDGWRMYSSPKSREPDSNGVCSACVRIFQKLDGEMEDPARLGKRAWIFRAEPMAERNSRRAVCRANSRKSFRRASYHQEVAGLYLKLILLTLGDSRWRNS